MQRFSLLPLLFGAEILRKYVSEVESESPEKTVFSASLSFDATSLLSASNSIRK